MVRINTSVEGVIFSSFFLFYLHFSLKTNINPWCSLPQMEMRLHAGLGQIKVAVLLQPPCTIKQTALQYQYIQYAYWGT